MESTDQTRFSGLVAAIYDAAVEPTIWTEVLGEATRFVGGYSSSIHSKSLDGRATGVYHDDGVLPEADKRAYFERFIQLDPATISHIYAEIDQPISITDVMDLDEFHDSRFFREWVAPLGLADFLSAPIVKQGPWAAMFGVFRSTEQGLADAAMRHNMELLVPHVRRAVLIGQVIEEGSARVESLSTTLDGLAAGLYLVDGRGQIVHANASGEALLQTRLAATRQNGRLALLEREADTALLEALAAIGTAGPGLGQKGIAVPIRAADGSHHVAHVLPLTSGARRITGSLFSAAAAVFLHPATLHTPAVPELVARTFDLTLSELRVLLTVAQVGGVAETAAALGIGESTVKTHLHRVFTKTGTSRQADLVRLLAGFSGPLDAGNFRR